MKSYKAMWEIENQNKYQIKQNPPPKQTPFSENKQNTYKTQDTMKIPKDYPGNKQNTLGNMIANQQLGAGEMAQSLIA